MKVVCSESQLNRSNPMKISVLRFLAFVLTVCTPMIILGNRTLEFSKVSAYNIGTAVKKVDPSIAVKDADFLYSELSLVHAGISFEAFSLALKGFDRLTKKGLLNSDSILTIVDFTKSSKQKRLAVIHLKTNEVVYSSVVAHGRNTGAEYARSFSNQPSSNKSSLGFYITQETYLGAHGLSLKLDGFEKGINDKARERAIVMHGADYAHHYQI